jgi:type I restriction enzyme S subunit
VPLPPLTEQEEIAQALNAADLKLDSELRRQQELDAVFKTLLHNLMTGKVRVADVDLNGMSEAE